MNQQQDKIEGAPLIRPSTTDHPLYEPVVDACQSGQARWRDFVTHPF